MCNVVVKKFTFAISSPDEFLVFFFVHPLPRTVHRVYGRGPEKLHEAGAHREISRFPGGPVRHCILKGSAERYVNMQYTGRPSVFIEVMADASTLGAEHKTVSLAC